MELNPVKMKRIRFLLKGWRRIYRRCFDNPDGRKVLADIRAECEFHKTPYVAGDTHETARMCGRQEVYRMIVDRMEATDEDIEREAQSLSVEDVASEGEGYEAA